VGTKNKPGSFDCYASAEPDEPMFTLLARDPLAGHLVSVWSKLRYGDIEAAHAVFCDMVTKHSSRYTLTPDVAKAGEAMDCSLAMFDWRKQHRPE
jgi:hypothetical protein